jgi:DNA-binding HxlR family transcriptional regulator
MTRTTPSVDTCVTGAAHLRRAFDFLGKRWVGVLIGHLAGGPAGFRDLSRAIDGISDSVLSDRLQTLTEAGLISRTVDPGPPLAVAYELSEAGRAVIPALAELTRWAEANLSEA